MKFNKKSKEELKEKGSQKKGYKEEKDVMPKGKTMKALYKKTAKKTK